MPTLSMDAMRSHLRRSITSLNLNKLRGLLAEVELRKHLKEMGYHQRVSPGGWIARRKGPGEFGRNTVVIFPETVYPCKTYAPECKVVRG